MSKIATFQTIVQVPSEESKTGFDLEDQTIGLNIIDFPVVSVKQGPWLYDGDVAQSVIELSNEKTYTVLGSVESISKRIDEVYAQWAKISAYQAGH